MGLSVRSDVLQDGVLGGSRSILPLSLGGENFPLCTLVLLSMFMLGCHRPKQLRQPIRDLENCELLSAEEMQLWN